MTNTVQLILAFGLLAVEIIGIAIYAIVSSEWWARLYSDKIEKATIHVWNGKGWDPKKGQLISVIKGEYIYAYNWYKQIFEVHCPKDYPVQYEKRKREVRAQPGRYLALPLSIEDKSGAGYTEAMLAQGQLVYATVALIKTLKKSGIQITATMLIIGALVIIALVGGIWYYQSHNKASETKPTVTTSTNTTHSTTIPTIKVNP
jgi:hypothetical protein